MDRRIFLLSGLACLTAGARAGMPAVVLVVGGDSPIERLTAEEARRLYLGVPLHLGGRPLRPLHNGSDPVVAEIFLQRVLFMSLPAYEAQLRVAIARHGGLPPPVVADAADLVATLCRDPLAVSYMARTRASTIPVLRAVGEL